MPTPPRRRQWKDWQDDKVSLPAFVVVMVIVAAAVWIFSRVGKKLEGLFGFQEATWVVIQAVIFLLTMAVIGRWRNSKK
jgi:sterol desaturase/sphingolipid hydroxylase (fatty acid hydroxylase superfamily)